MKMKKLVATLLCICLIVSVFAGCSSSDNPSNPDTPDNPTVGSNSGGEVSGTSKDQDGNGIYDHTVFALRGDPADLLPWNININTKEPIYYAIWESLYDFLDGEYVPHLATGAPVQVDATHYDVTIYDYITDIKGNNITADDVVWCYNRFMEAGYTAKFTAYESIEAVDTYTVRFTWAYEPTGVRELERPLCYVPIYCAAEFNEATFATNPVTTGIYKVESFVPGSSCTIVRRDDYWQTDESLCNEWQHANVDRIDFQVITESAQSLVAIQNGSIDWSDNIPDENWADYEGGQNGYQTHLTSGTDFYFLATNQSADNPLNDVNLRLAIFYAINNDELAGSMYGRIPSRSLGVESCPDYAASWSSTPNYINTYDLDLAKEYLEKSNYNGETLTMRTGNTEEFVNVASIVQLYLEQIGVKTTIVTMDETTMVAEMNTDGIWDLAVLRGGGSFWIKAVNKFMNNQEYNGEFCMNFIYDETLQELFEVANNESGWNEENCSALLNYDLEQAYHYCIFSCALPWAVNTDVTDIYFLADTVALPSLSTYNLD